MGALLKSAAIALSKHLAQSFLSDSGPSQSHLMEEIRRTTFELKAEIKEDFKMALTQAINLLLVKAALTAIFTVTFLLSMMDALRQLDINGQIQGTVFLWGTLALAVLSAALFFMVRPKHEPAAASATDVKVMTKEETIPHESREQIYPHEVVSEQASNSDSVEQPYYAMVKSTNSAEPLSFPNPSATELILQELKTERELFFSRQ